MVDSAFNSTVANMAAIILTDSITTAARISDLKDTPQSAIDRITPSLLIGSAVTNDLNKSKGIKPTIVLSDQQKGNIKKAFNTVHNHLKLSLSTHSLSNKLFSKEFAKQQASQADIIYENSRLVSQTFNIIGEQQRVDAKGESSGKKDEVKLPDSLRDQIARLNKALSQQPSSNIIALAESLTDFWQGFAQSDTKSLTVADEIRTKVAESVNDQLSRTADNARQQIHKPQNSPELSAPSRDTEQEAQSNRYAPTQPNQENNNSRNDTPAIDI